MPIVAGPEAPRPAEAAGDGGDERPPLGTVMLAVALGEILAAIVAVGLIVGLAALDVPEGVAIAAAAAGYVVDVAIWAWAANGMLRALSGWEPGRSATLCAVAIGTAIAGAAALPVGYALRDAPLVISGTLGSALYVLVPSVLLPRLAPVPPRWAVVAAALLVAVGVVAIGFVVADELG